MRLEMVFPQYIGCNHCSGGRCGFWKPHGTDRVLRALTRMHWAVGVMHIGRQASRRRMPESALKESINQPVVNPLFIITSRTVDCQPFILHEPT